MKKLLLGLLLLPGLAIQAKEYVAPVERLEVPEQVEVPQEVVTPVEQQNVPREIEQTTTEHAQEVDTFKDKEDSLSKADEEKAWILKMLNELPNPNCLLGDIAVLKDEKHTKELFEKEQTVLDTRLPYYLVEVHKIHIMKSYNKESNKIKEEETKVMAEFYREKLNKFNSYSIEDQALLLAEAEQRLGLVYNSKGLREEAFKAALEASGHGNKTSQEEILNSLVNFINCMNNASQDNTLEHAVQCVKTNVKIDIK